MVGRNMTEEQRRRKREKDKGKRGKTEWRRGGKHKFRCSRSASSAFQEFFPFSLATMKFKINLPFPVLSSKAKIVRTK